MMKRIVIIIITCVVVFGCQQTNNALKSQSVTKYEANWRSLKQHRTPQWLRDGKFGIYTHWDFFPVWDKRYDCSDPKYAGLYGQIHAKDEERREEMKRYPGYHIYKDKIQSITMLGDDKPLEWDLTPMGLKIKTPKNKPCEHAFVFKIVRRSE